jgi:hypothetical protein
MFASNPAWRNLGTSQHRELSLLRGRPNPGRGRRAVRDRPVVSHRFEILIGLFAAAQDFGSNPWSSGRRFSIRRDQPKPPAQPMKICRKLRPAHAFRLKDD